MLHKSVRLIALAAFAAAIAVSADVSGAAAQSVPTAEAQAFIGTWSLELEGDQPFTLPLEVQDNSGQVAAEVGSIMGGDPIAVSSIAKAGEGLVFSYSADFQGQDIPVAITLTPATDGMRASVDFADGQFTVTGDATKE